MGGPVRSILGRVGRDKAPQSSKGTLQCGSGVSERGKVTLTVQLTKERAKSRSAVAERKEVAAGECSKGQGAGEYRGVGTGSDVRTTPVRRTEAADRKLCCWRMRHEAASRASAGMAASSLGTISLCVYMYEQPHMRWMRL